MMIMRGQVIEVHLRHVTVDRFDGDFAHTAEKRETEKQVAKTAGKAAERASNHPDMLLRVDLLRVRDAGS